MTSWWNKFIDGCKYLTASFAIILVKRKLKRRPHDWTLWLTIARLYEIGYQWPQAIDALKRARKLDPGNEVIAQLLASTREKAREKD